MARAIKTMGFTRLALIRPGRLAVPEHEMAQKMAVRSWDVLDSAERHSDFEAGLAGVDIVAATTSRSGIKGVLTAREGARWLQNAASPGRRLALVLGNEKSGLTSAELDRADIRIRIPMSAEQPSINLAQAAQILAYELFLTALEARETPAE